MSLHDKLKSYPKEYDLSDIHIRSNQPFAIRENGEIKVFSEDTLSYYSSSFIVEDIDYENKYTQANHKLLKKISKKSNGTFNNYSEFELLNEFVSKKNFVSESEIESVKSEDIKKNEWILLILLLIVTSEILVRRISGKK